MAQLLVAVVWTVIGFSFAHKAYKAYADKKRKLNRIARRKVAARRRLNANRRQHQLAREQVARLFAAVGDAARAANAANIASIGRGFAAISVAAKAQAFAQKEFKDWEQAFGAPEVVKPIVDLLNKSDEQHRVVRTGKGKVVAAVIARDPAIPVREH